MVLWPSLHGACSCPYLSTYHCFKYSTHWITVVQIPPSLQYYRLCSIRCPFLYCNFIHNKGTRNFNDSHGRMGLVMLILTKFQMLFGIFRPRLPFPGSDKEKAMVRKGWEGGHRLLGTALLLCGFWQMSSSINSFSSKYSVSASDEGRMSTALCVWVGAKTATIVVQIWYSKIRKTKSSNPIFTSPVVEDTDTGVIIPKDRIFDAEYDSADKENPSDPSCAPPMLDYNHSCLK